MTTSYAARPLSDRTWLRPRSKREATRFRAKWSETLELLGREVELLRGRDLVIEVDVQPGDLRLDGTLRAKARAASPAVAVSFESKHGPLMYRCDRFYAPYYSQPDDWQQNVRAIALTLEALRAVDRYGAAESGEQYRGYTALATAPFVVPSTDPWAVLRDLTGIAGAEGLSGERVISLARRNAHPDHGGTSDTWARFTAALEAVVKERSQAVRP